MVHIEKIFTDIGGQFLTSPSDIATKLQSIKAFVFDWDGVFNNGEKEGAGSSTFSEVDSMGTNLLRFSHWLEHKELPTCAIISGEKNQTAFWFCTREHYHVSYFKVAHKIEALDHFCTHHTIKHDEVAYFFDDILDLSVAQVAGIRILINRKANPLFKNYVKENKLADYITGAESGKFPVREGCEMLMGLRGNYDEVLSKRSAYGHIYKEYIEARNKIETSFFTKDGKSMTEKNPTNNL